MRVLSVHLAPTVVVIVPTLEMQTSDVQHPPISGYRQADIGRYRQRPTFVTANCSALSKVSCLRPPPFCREHSRRLECRILLSLVNFFRMQDGR